MGDVYEVEKIVDKKFDKNGKALYFIKWKDWHESTNTWEPEEHLANSAKLVADFNATWKGKDDSKSSGTAKSTAKKGKKTASVRENTENKKASIDSEIPEQCGFDKGYVPEKIVGATDSGGTIKFLVKWKDKNDVELITNERARRHCPQLVIRFYEQNIHWDEN